MNLRTYLDNRPRGGLTELAGRLGISTVYLSQLSVRQDGRVPSPELAVQIAKETGNVVARWDLRPEDWHRIWPELIGLEGAPEVPAKNEA